MLSTPLVRPRRTLKSTVLRLRHRVAPPVLTLAALVGLAACSDDALPTRPETAPAKPLARISVQYTSNSWGGRVAMPTARRGLVTATLNGLIFAIGGRSAGETNLATVETFSPLLPPLLTWGTAPSLPAPRAFASGAAVINGKIYVPGGLNAQASATKSLFVNDGATNSWSTKAPLPVASYGGAAAAINGKLYVFTPSGQGGYLHRYDPGTNTWTQRAAPPHAHLYAASGVINGKFYLAGGQEPNGTATSIVDVYNPATNQWTPKASMPTPRGFLSAANANGLLFALGGRSGNTVLKTNEAYSP